MSQFTTILAAGLLAFGAVRATAQDQPPTTSTSTQTSVNALELYRLPIDYSLRDMDTERWGINLTCPVSISGLRIQHQTNAGNLVRSLGVVAIVPGIQFEIPLASGVRLRPFAEAGVGKGTEGKPAQFLYGYGASVRFDRDVGPVHLIYGGDALRRRGVAAVGSYETHSTFEAGLDAQVPLGFTVAGRDARAGMYGIARAFGGLNLASLGLSPLDLDHVFEVGGSFSTAPNLKIWKIDFPWIAVGYQFGPELSGIRIYTSFPF
jgi:hypothetical protein